MSDSRNGDDGRDTGVEAAETALGFRQRGADATGASGEQRWTARLAPLWLEVPSVRPDPRVWHAVQRRLSGMRRSAPSPRPARRLPAFLQGLGLGVAAAAALAAAAVLGPYDVRSLVLGRQLVAVLGPDSASPLFTAVVDQRRGTLSFAPVTGAVQGPQVPQLWYVPQNGNPVPLGLIDPRRRTDITVPEAIIRRWAPGETLAVSLEPEGGSPTGLPTGPIIATGAVRTLE